MCNAATERTHESALVSEVWYVRNNIEQYSAVGSGVGEWILCMAWKLQVLFSEGLYACLIMVRENRIPTWRAKKITPNPILHQCSESNKEKSLCAISLRVRACLAHARICALCVCVCVFIYTRSHTSVCSPVFQYIHRHRLGRRRRSAASWFFVLYTNISQLSARPIFRSRVVVSSSSSLVDHPTQSPTPILPYNIVQHTHTHTHRSKQSNKNIHNKFKNTNTHKHEHILFIINCFLCVSGCKKWTQWFSFAKSVAKQCETDR